MKKNIKIYVIIAIALITTFDSCKKAIQIDPPIDKIIGKSLYKTDQGAASVLTGIYADMSGDIFFKGASSIGLMTGLYSDELSLNPAISNILSTIYSNNFTNQEPGIWGNTYGYIFRVNSAIEGISASATLSNSVKNQLLGEAKFLRAFYYFYLVNLYGDVPLVTTTNLAVNSTLARADKGIIYKQIEDDLIVAEQLLSVNYLGANITTVTTQRLRPNKTASLALLARVYVYEKKWVQAEATSTLIIKDVTNYSLPALSNSFLMNSSEIIWSLQPTTQGPEKTEASVYIIRTGLSSANPVYLSNNLLQSFELSDNRKNQWIGTYTDGSNIYKYPFKYKDLTSGSNLTEFIIVLRLAEQILIRAEARAQQGNVTGLNSAASDLNLIRLRAGLAATNANTQIGMLDAILQERKVELFCEWGHRFFDLKRHEKIDVVMSTAAPTKGGTWSSYKGLWPIPIQDIKINPSLKGHQNPGYSEN